MSKSTPHVTVDAKLLDALTEMVSQAAAAILAFVPSRVATRRKTDQSPVTEADEAADHVIAEGLERLLPGFPTISEERCTDAPALSEYASFALIDPLDGTREFLAGRDEFTVNVAILDRGRPIAGLIAVPARQLLYRAIVGIGAERLRLTPGDGPSRAHDVVPIHCRPAPADGLVAAVSRSHLDQASTDFLARFPNTQLMSVGSSVKFCWLAEGTADLYPRLTPIFAWDIAAGHAVLAAAGGTVLTPQGAELSYGRGPDGDFRVPGFIAWGDKTLLASAPS